MIVSLLELSLIKPTIDVIEPFLMRSECRRVAGVVDEDSFRHCPLLADETDRNVLIHTFLSGRGTFGKRALIALSAAIQQSNAVPSH